MTARPRILIVEDDYFVAQYIAEILRVCAAEPLGPAATVRDAQRIVDDEQPDGIILDVKLREEDTLSFADRLVAEHLPIVFSTGYLEEDLPERFRTTPRLTKPFRDTELQRCVERVFLGLAETDSH